MECLLKQYRPFQEFPAILANTKKEISVENNLISFASEQRNVVVREEKKLERIISERLKMQKKRQS